jgi:hypothetical protein
MAKVRVMIDHAHRRVTLAQCCYDAAPVIRAIYGLILYSQYWLYYEEEIHCSILITYGYVVIKRHVLMICSISSRFSRETEI